MGFMGQGKEFGFYSAYRVGQKLGALLSIWERIQ